MRVHWVMVALPFAGLLVADSLVLHGGGPTLPAWGAFGVWAVMGLVTLTGRYLGFPTSVRSTAGKPVTVPRRAPPSRMKPSVKGARRTPERGARRVTSKKAS